MRAARAAAEQEVRRALAARPATAALAQARLAPIVGGLSNFSWCASTPAGERHFVRLGAPDAERLGADRHNECRVLALAAAAGVAPPVLLCDPQQRLLVTHWVAAVPAGAAVRRAALRALGVSLARLHAVEPVTALRRVDFESQAVVLREAAADAAVHAFDGPARIAFARLNERRPRLVLCHHDLNPLNLLWEPSGRPWLVDWEYAGLGDPALDLASFATQHRLDAAGRAALLQQYVAAGGDADAGRLEAAGWAFDYVQWLWYRAAAVPGRGAVAPAGELEQRAAVLGQSLRRRARALARSDNE